MSSSLVAESKSPVSRWLPTRTIAFRVTIVYILVCTLWILSTGWLLHHFVTDTHLEAILEVLKGWVFVLITGILLGFALDRYFRDIRHAAEALQTRLDLQDQLTRIIATVPGMICSFLQRPDGSVSMPFATPVIEELYGVRLEEVRHDFSPAFALIHAEDVEHLRAGIAESARTLKPWRDTFRVRHPHKGELWLEGHSVPRREPDGSTLWHGFVQDVTERRRAEQVLRESEERFRGTLDSMLEGCQIIGPDWRFRYVNTAAAEQGRTTVKALLGRTMMDVYPGIETTCVFEALKRCMQEGQPQHLEHEFVFQDGSKAWFELVCQRTVEGIFVLTLDITQRKRGDAQLRQLSSAVEHSPTSIVITDRAGSIEYVNPKFTQLTGYSLAEVFGRNPRMLKSGALPPEVYREMWDTILAGKEWRGELNNRKKNGESYWELASISPIVNPAGAITHFVAVKEDITERKRLEAQLRQAQKLEAIGQLAGGVAHDFNNILAAIIMQIGLLQMNSNLNEEIRQALKELEAGAQRAASLTRQLLMFSRRSVLAVKPVDLNEVVTHLLKMLNRLIGEQIDLRFDRKTDLPIIDADAGMLDQVLMNLVVNARDAMPKGGRVTIGTSVAHLDAAQAAENPERRQGSFVCLKVLDTGCGMDITTSKRIFEPFFTTKEIGKGTGLGLATVHGIVAQHKGWVEVESEVGRGTCFLVYFPVSDLGTQVARARTKQPVKHGTETILLVEDDLEVRRLFCQALRALGYQVHEATDGPQAMEIWKERSSAIDLLLTDMVMPQGVTGLELAERLQALKPSLKVIISSGYSAEMVQVGPPKKQSVVYLPKPYEAKVLADTVRNCLDLSNSAEGFR